MLVKLFMTLRRVGKVIYIREKILDLGIQRVLFIERLQNME